MSEIVLLLTETQNGDHLTIVIEVWLLYQSGLRIAFWPLKSGSSVMLNTFNAF